MYLSSFFITEPEDGFYLYYPSWLNVRESNVYRKSLKSTAAHAWGFKRFGTTKDVYAREMIRTPSCKGYTDAMEQVSDVALHQLSSRERMMLLKSKTAFIYVDSWGESGSLEDIPSVLHATTIDTLPKNLVKKFSVKDFTCKIRGEKQSLMQAMKLAQDYLDWGVFDFVVICAAYRAVPILAFSDEDMPENKKQKVSGKEIKMNLSVERVGCFIFSNKESSLKIRCGNYVLPAEDDRQLFPGKDEDINMITFSGLRKSDVERAWLSNMHSVTCKAINLVDIYGNSGCVSPALSWVYLEQNDSKEGRMRTVVPDNFGGYSWFDTWY